MALVEVANISAGGLLVAGGLAGYIRKNSTISLVAGATTGSALIAAGVLSHRQPRKPYGSVLGLTTSALLAIAILAKCKKNSAPLTLKSPSLYVSLTGLVLAAINAAVIYRLQK